MDPFLIVLIGFVAVWLVVILPQRRRVNAHKRMVAAVTPGDEIVTVGGVYGRVTGADDDDLTLEVAPGVEVRLARRAVAEVVSGDGAAGERAEEVPG